MAISTNPTKTRGIEKAWNREINKRWRIFTRTVLQELRRVNALTVNVFDVDPAHLRAYIAFFQQQIDELLVGDWQEQYQRRSYELAIGRAMSTLRSQGLRTGTTAIDRARAARITQFTAIPSLGLTPVEFATFPIHQETLGFLFTRSFEALEGLTTEMARNVRTILFNGVQAGQGVGEVTRLIRDRIDVGKSRARLIAQTETIQAFQRGTINQAELASEFLGEPVLLRWLTRRDSRVRDLHAAWHGTVKNQKETFKRINVSPFNCRCAVSPVIKEADTPLKRKKFKAERKELQSLTGGG